MKKRIKNWFEDNWGLVFEALSSFCIASTLTFWTTVIIAAIKGLKPIWVPRK